MNRRLSMVRRPAAVALLGLALAAGTGSPAFAAGNPAPPSGDGDVSVMGIPCDGYVGSWYAVSNVAKPKKITHATRHYNGTSSDMTSNYTTGHQLTLTAGITITSGSSISASAIIGELEASTSMSLAVSGSATTSSSVSVTATVKPKKYVVTYAGRVQVTGNWIKQTCSSGGSMVVTSGQGTGKSFHVQEVGAAQCDITQPSGSMAALAKSQYC
ncbi:hypothetical protein SAMN05444365_1011082 [Micromonospora pattaloongensis]|uniref:Ig-like domain-containing protein n=1 Tax=Micromonospora pattaloongensis TaxID=405436 RepID=A0A1H3I1M0_9ACTN|nr:hypothetical protein [Micromonospora pattaloongensis]SDY21583.1 hypothetical protein SAMN05444365_1011082 [Micromonospora pattaloongensis]